MSKSTQNNFDVTVLPLQGVMNFREVGGYPTTDGRRVKRGVLWRSAGLDTPTLTDIQKIKQINLVSIIDLRGGEERLTNPTHMDILENVDTHYTTTSGFRNRSELAQAFKVGIDPASFRQSLLQLYASIADHHSSQLHYAFDRLAHDHVPMLIHCTAGKDRTGIAVALILEAIGVDREFILADYTKTNDLLDWDRLSIAAAAGTGLGSEAIADLHPDAQKMLTLADQAYLEAAIDDINTRYGSVLAFLNQRVGVNDEMLSRVRDNLLEE